MTLDEEEESDGNQTNTASAADVQEHCKFHNKQVHSFMCITVQGAILYATLCFVYRFAKRDQ